MMEQAKIKRWERFYRDVVMRGSEWPRELWLAAVGDALTAALPEDSALPGDFRRTAAELQNLDRTNRGSYLEERRMGQLEAQIQHLIGTADHVIRGPRRGAAALDAADDDEDLPEPRPARWNIGAVIGSAGLAVLLFGAAVALATHLYDMRLAAQVTAEVERHVQEIQRSITRVEEELLARSEAADEESARLAALREELAAQVDEFSAKIAESLDTMVRLREAAFADVQQQIENQSGATVELLDRLHRRAAALDRGLDQVSEDLATLERRVPQINQSLTRLGEDIAGERKRFDATSEQVTALGGVAPELIAWVDGERGELEQTLAAKAVALAELEQQIAALEETYEASGQGLARFQTAVADGLQQVQRDRAGFRQAVQEMRSTGTEAAELVSEASADLAQMQSRVEKEVDALLGRMAERADLAVLRSEDVLQRSEREAARKLAAAAEDALGVLQAKNAESLKGLEEEARATRAELEETRAQLLASWRQMDRMLASRQHEMLSGLDRHAASMEERVKEFLAALDVKTPAPVGGGG